MPRKSPRSRRKPVDPPRVPAASRTRATPGKTRLSPQPRVASTKHAPKGARPAAKLADAKRKAAAKTRRAIAAPARARRRFKPPDPARVAAILAGLAKLYPHAITALNFETPLQLLLATILSAQCTDERVNKTTPALFARYRDARAFVEAKQEDLEEMVRSTGFYRNKARAIKECCADIVTKHGGEVPNTLEALTALHGVGRKTANVVLGNAFGIPGLVVDTHVTRLSNRLALTNETDAVKIEFALMPIVPRERWTLFSHWLILHGRAVCIARKPKCSVCAIAAHCPRIGVTVSQ